MLRKVNSDLISDNAKEKNNKVDKDAPRTLQLEEVLEEDPPLSKSQQLALSLFRFLAELVRQCAIVLCVFVVFYILAAPLLIGSFLYESGTREYTFRYVATAFTSVFLLLGFVELGLHMLEVANMFKFRFWLQRILHLYVPFPYPLPPLFFWFRGTWILGCSARLPICSSLFDYNLQIYLFVSFISSFP